MDNVRFELQLKCQNKSDIKPSIFSIHELKFPFDFIYNSFKG